MPIQVKRENTYEKIAKKVTKDVNNAFNNLANSLSILVGSETPTLDEAIKSGHNLAVKAVIFKGNYQITKDTLNLAIESHDPDIVKYIIELKDIQINADHIINSLEHLDGNVWDDIQQRTEVAKALVLALRAKGEHKKEEVESVILKAAIEKDNYPAVELLSSLNFYVSQEHIDCAMEAQLMGDSVMGVLNKKMELQNKRANKQESINGFRLFGEGFRSNSAFTVDTPTGPTKIPPEIMFKIAQLAENKTQPLDDQAKQRVFNKKF